MELWYTDEHTSDVRFSMKASMQVASTKSAVQQIDILDTPAYGRVLVLDGGLMITEKDDRGAVGERHARTFCASQAGADRPPPGGRCKASWGSASSLGAGGSPSPASRWMSVMGSFWNRWELIAESPVLMPAQDRWT